MTWTIETVRDGAVDASSVFRLYADPSTWTDWGHNATRARAVEPLTEGGIVEVRANYGRVYRCLIRRFVVDRVLELEVRPPFLVVIQTYELDDGPDGVRVRHALEISGPLSGILRVGGAPRMYKRLLDKEVGRVIEMAGARSLAAP